MEKRPSFLERIISNIFLIIGYLILFFTGLYLVFSIIFIINSKEIVLIILNLILLSFEIIGLFFGFYLFFNIAMSFKGPIPTKDYDGSYVPNVSVIFPIFNEHHDVLIQSIEASNELDYPKEKLEVVVIDDSDNEDQREYTQKICNKLSVTYKSRNNRDGFKAGAINSILHDLQGEIMIILDADHSAFPDLVKRLVTPFEDDQVALVQAKLSFRNLDTLTRRSAALVHSEFYEVFERGKDVIGTASFSGTTGALRKSVLEKIGGMSEDTIVEDADTATILLTHGYKTKFVNFYGSVGLTPWNFSSHIGQLWRLTQGTTAVFKKRTKAILTSQLSLTKKFDVLTALAVTPAGICIPLMTLFLAFLVILNQPLIRPNPNLFFIMPSIVLLGHTLSTIIAIRRIDSDRVPHFSLWEIIPFSIFSLMVIPFFVSAVISGLK
ncbi:MAG: glycosyltransferase, partial [Candidatus Hodarchaeales archaeon]